jgi:hypothetical protein
LRSFLLIPILAFITQAQEAQSGAKTVKLERGQVLQLMLSTPLDSGSAQVGDEVSLKLLRPLIAEGTTVLPRGSIIRGRVTKVRRAAKNCNSGNIEWKLERVPAMGRQKIKIQIVSYAQVHPGNILTDRVFLDSTGKKIARIAENTVIVTTVVVPLAVIASPLLIAMVIGMSGEGRCGGVAGSEESVSPGTAFYAAVSKNVRFPRP